MTPPENDGFDEPIGIEGQFPEVVNLTDLGNSRVFVQIFGKDLRWCGAMPGSGWMVWDKSRWRSDDTKLVLRHAAEVGPEWLHRMPDPLPVLSKERRAAMEDEEVSKYLMRQAEIEGMREAYQKHAKRCEAAGSMKSLIELAAAHERIATRKDAWDADIWLFNTPDRTYDPRTMLSHPPKREELITRMATVGADASEKCPTWLQFLSVAMDGDQDMVAFLQRAVGYCLTGSTGEQCLFIAYGRGANGKSTFMDTVSYLLGDYATTIGVETFVNRREGAIPNDLAALAGARLVVCSEGPEGGGLDEALVKLVTGGDPISARFLNREFFTFKPAFKLWMLTNHKPVIKGTDDGIWRRLRLVPFTVTIPKEERDPELPAKLKAEATAIMQWAVEGLKEWMRIGLAPPAKVLEATEDYRAEMDILGDFLEDKCCTGENLEATNKEVYGAYQEWAKSQGLGVRSQKWLSRALKDRGFKQAEGRADGRKWVGFSVLAAPIFGQPRPDPRLAEHLF